MLRRFLKKKCIYWLSKPIIITISYLINRLIPEKFFTKIWYLTSFGKLPNLKNPQTLNEKINWLKLYNRNSLQTICADKIKMREFALQKLGKDYTVPLVFVTADVKNLKPENFPNFPVIVKCNHDSHGGVVVFDKENVDWSRLQKNFKKRLCKNYYYPTKEWQYKNIEPKILVEKFLGDKAGKLPYDYKVHCFNGKYITVQVDIDRNEDYRRNWYVNDWKDAPFYWPFLKGGIKLAMPYDGLIERPSRFNEMIQLSEKLAKSFILSRIDWYEVNKELYLGEITYHHNSGMGKIIPNEWDYKLGQILKLPFEK